jgi:hypothetical protein
MWSMATGKAQRCAAIFAAVMLGVSASALAQQKTYEGEIIALDRKADTFTVKGSESGEVMEMAFHVAPTSVFIIDGEPLVFGEVLKGDHVVVTYGSSGAIHTASRVARVRAGSRETTFSGNVIGVDSTNGTFTVRNTTDGKAREMEFHVSPSARLYISGDEVLLSQLRKGDAVTVAYDSADMTRQARHLKKRT